ncbi:hypothetical protein L1286_22320 [Pseudoalteromonas sp. SMS1]|uniref:flagellar basal body rod protein FlgC n=1 Tax=Pseudoalteromonas sp. SMS1 TaxID=2908894 RepID=UPI001F3DD80A|nr:flagellar basal body rod C-terminal domain-containing protein [Pseudoalteromonas sp. SMS1]MCF2860220.1 hypothetical protein [Pseudoalteromonas sp. SMS1]
MAHDIYAISMSGMSYERARLEAAAHNIAHANTISANATHVVKLKEVASVNSFASLLNSDSAHLTEVAQFKAVYKPQHALADEKGFVYMPDVNIASEMLKMNSATRAYEANVKAFNAYKTMSSKSMEIGK